MDDVRFALRPWLSVGLCSFLLIWWRLFLLNFSC